MSTWEQLSVREKNALIEMGSKENRRVQKRHVVFARLAAMGLLEAIEQKDVFIVYRLTEAGWAVLRGASGQLPEHFHVLSDDDVRALKQTLESAPHLPDGETGDAGE